jgi:hypothetical protein
MYASFNTPPPFFPSPPHSNSALRRFSLSDRIVDFDQDCHFSPTNSRLNSEDLLQYYLVEEENSYIETSAEEKKFLDFEFKEKPLNTTEKPLYSQMIPETIEKPKIPEKSMIIEEKEPGFIAKIEANKNSPEKNNINEAFSLQMSAFPCNCKKSKCLKLYCECFAKGRLCTSLCNCSDCCNKEPDCKLRKLALRNTYLKSHKTEKDTEEILDLDLQSFVFPNNTSKSLGCNCKKSHCKKKYCECFDEGKACGNLCKCEGCKNYLGVRIRGKKEKGNKKNGNAIQK